jgi:UDP-2-acetamido-2,6-beta-L-arabino-hexul-4-ose reductase
MNTIKVGITGFTGFIGSHLIERLVRDKNLIVIPIEDELFFSVDKLANAVKECDCIVHLAGVNRGDDETVYRVNIDLAEKLVSAINKFPKSPQIIFSSSTYTLNSPETAFARAKKEVERIFEAWAKRNNAPLLTLIIPNVFGDNCRPFYNSVVATFCYQLTHNEEPQIIEDREIELIYINELTEIIRNMIKPLKAGIESIRIKGTKTIKVSKLLSILEGFKKNYYFKDIVPELSEIFLKYLYNVFLSYVDFKELKRVPKMEKDARGILFEIIKLGKGGQIFFSTTKPNVVRGNHYHTRKIERFCVLKGNARIRLRKINTLEVKEYNIWAEEPAFVEIPVFYTHNIENTGTEDLLTLFWCNEIFDPNDPDTFYEEVVKS